MYKMWEGEDGHVKGKSLYLKMKDAEPGKGHK